MSNSGYSRPVAAPQPLLKRLKEFASDARYELGYRWDQHKGKIILGTMALTFAAKEVSSFINTKLLEDFGGKWLTQNVHIRNSEAEVRGLGVVYNAAVKLGRAAPIQEDEPSAADTAFNRGLQNTVSAENQDLGCKSVVMTLNQEKSNLLRHIFADQVTVSHYAQGAFNQSKRYYCLTDPAPKAQ